MKIRCLIVDDEPLAIKILENYIEKVPQLDWVASCRSALEASEWVSRGQLDLIFLDISMPQLSGLQFAKSLAPHLKIIFTTAYRDFAVESYEVRALDYLVKPFSFERFWQAIHKLQLDKQENNAKNTLEEAFIYLKAEKKVFKIMLSDILYIESLKDYIIVHTPTQKILTYQHISHIEAELPTEHFLRIHRSFIIGLKYLRSFSSTSIYLTNNQELSIGRTYKDEVMKVLNLPL
jgi:DNA-binding LytR/AlgR family response regulator